jgi:hypothetical protein
VVRVAARLRRPYLKDTSVGARRALLIGSQTGGLTGVHDDVEVMADVLRRAGFDVRSIIEREASAEGMRGAYHQLIEDTGGDDAAVVYYSGHGARVRNAMRSRDASLPPWLQYVVPTDIDDRSGGRFGGVLAEELSALQWQLTERTPNVTTILDCCHSSRMSRNPGIVPRADARIGFPWDAVAASWAASRGRAGPGDANVTAVQVVACEPDQSAYEVAASSIGGTHGALTAALVGVLRRPDAAMLSWTEVMQVVRPAVLDAVTGQRPDLLGTQSARNRVLFTLQEKDTVGVMPIAVDGEQAWLDGAALFGVADGDRYAVVGPGGDVDQPVATATVDGVRGDRARLHLDGATAAELPAGALAHPSRSASAAVRSPCCPQGTAMHRPCSRCCGAPPTCGPSTTPAARWRRSGWRTTACCSSTAAGRHSALHRGRSGRAISNAWTTSCGRWLGRRTCAISRLGTVRCGARSRWCAAGSTHGHDRRSP